MNLIYIPLLQTWGYGWSHLFLGALEEWSACGGHSSGLL